MKVCAIMTATVTPDDVMKEAVASRSRTVKDSELDILAPSRAVARIRLRPKSGYDFTGRVRCVSPPRRWSSDKRRAKLRNDV